MFTAENISSANTSTPTLSHYEIFIRKTCPNCPPVKDYILSTTLDGKIVDTDTDEGLSRASEKGVLSTPTVIFYDDSNREI